MGLVILQAVTFEQPREHLELKLAPRQPVTGLIASPLHLVRVRVRVRVRVTVRVRVSYPN